MDDTEFIPFPKADDSRPTTGAVAVVGGGIAGTQAALDLAAAGFRVHLIEKGPSLGGVMAQLDKTFPTNDCSMCILSPKLVEAARHPNIRILTHAQLTAVSGEPGDLTVSVKQAARHVDPDVCTGCGLCAEKCPVKVPNEYDESLGIRKAIYIPFAQAVPLIYSIDWDACRNCGICEKVCPADAVRYDDAQREVDLKVGSIILTPGFEKFDCAEIPSYAYSMHPDIISAVEFERLLSANGPTGGHLQRLSNGAALKRIAFVQCAGSRDENHNPYCSSICCMASVKEAIIAKEHAPSLETEIFYMDMRAVGKDFERFYNRAENEYGVVFTRARVAEIVPPVEPHGSDDTAPPSGSAPDERSGDPITVVIETENGTEERQFDLVVLASALEPLRQAQELAATAGISLDEFGFALDGSIVPGTTTRPGVFTAGAFGGPCDIPETVAQASAVAGMAGALLAPGRFESITEKELPEERDVSAEEPRIGVFVCHCGINIGSVVDVPSVVDHAAALPGVIYAGENLFTCSEDTQHRIKEFIEEQGINRLVVAACSPRTHEPLFRATMKEAGLNPSLFEMANIRDQCSWVHRDIPDEASSKARQQVSMAVARAREMRPIEAQIVSLTPSVLVVGGGIAGVSAALCVAENGFETYLVEKEQEIGGLFKRLSSLSDTDTPPLKIMDELVRKVNAHPLIHLHTGSRLESVEGYVGNFTSHIHNSTGEVTEVSHGAIIVATGASELDRGSALQGFAGTGEKISGAGGDHGHGQGILTMLDLEEQLDDRDNNASSKNGAIAFIQCAGSRNDERPYCSRICCSASLKNAIRLKELNPERPVTILYRDMRAYGMHELLYRKAASLGVTFIRYPDDKYPEIRRSADDPAHSTLAVSVHDASLDETITIPTDTVVLAAATVANTDNAGLAELLKVPLNSDGFFLEAHVKLRPVDFATDGIFLAGAAHSPKTARECMTQAIAAASRSVALLSSGEMTMDSTPAMVDGAQCTGCGTCLRICPYGAIIKSEEGKAEVIVASCKGCGACASICPENAIAMLGFSNEEILAEMDALLSDGEVGA